MYRMLLPLLYIAFNSCKEDVSKQKYEHLSTPNIIFIFADDQGYRDVGAFSTSDIATPNLDQMATDGVKLSSYYAAQAVCSASRAGILTGRYPNRIGIHNAMMPKSKVRLNPSETPLAEMLWAKG